MRFIVIEQIVSFKNTLHLDQLLLTREAFWMTQLFSLNPLRPNSDLSQISHCNSKGLYVREVMRIENMITQVKFY